MANKVIQTGQILAQCGEDGPAVSVTANSHTAGIWASTGKGTQCVGLVADKDTGPYLVIWEGDEKGLPSVAVTGEGVQTPDFDPTKAKFITFAELTKALGDLK